VLSGTQHDMVRRILPSRHRIHVKYFVRAPALIWCLISSTASWLSQCDDFRESLCVASALKASDNRFETLVVKMMISAAAVAV